MEGKELVKLELKVPGITPEKGIELQHDLAENLAIYRVFVNGFTKRIKVVFDEREMSKEELLDALGEFSPEVIKEERITLSELIEGSMSWKNLIKSKSSADHC